MEAVESDTTIYIMTERIRPLRVVLPSWKSKTVQEREDWLLWGLHRISVCHLVFALIYNLIVPAEDSTYIFE